MGNCKIQVEEFSDIQDVNNIISTALTDYVFDSWSLTVDSKQAAIKAKNNILNKYVKGVFKNTHQVLEGINPLPMLHDFLSLFINENIKNDINIELLIPTVEELAKALEIKIPKTLLTETDKEENTTERIESYNQSRTLRNQVVSRFMEKAFGYSYSTVNYAKLLGVSGIISAAVIDRKNGNPISTIGDINANLRTFQQELFDKVILYHNKMTNNQKIPTSIYDDNGVTDALLKIAPFALQYLTSKQFPSSTLDTLNLNITNNSINQDDRLAYDAYVSWILLTNFDDFIRLTFGSSIEINPRSKRFTLDNDKYKIADKAANMNQTWRRDENIDVIAELDNIVKNIINTTPRYGYRGSTPLINTYLTYQQFISVISKIKNLAVSLYDDIRFDNLSESLRRALNPSTYAYIRGKSLKDLVVLLSTETEEALPAVIDVLANEVVKGKLLQNFNNDDYAIILSIHKEITGDLKDKLTIFSIMNKNPNIDKNYFEYITQNVLSIFPIKYLLFFRKEGEVYGRNMSNLVEDLIKRLVQSTINAHNSKLTVANLESDFGTGYKVLEHRYSVKTLENKDGIYAILFNPIIDLDYKAEINLTTGEVTRVTANRNIKLDFSYDPKINFDNLTLVFIDVLGIDLRNPKYKLLLLAQYNDVNGEVDYNALTVDLFTMTAHVIANQYLSNVLLKDAKTVTSIRQILLQRTNLAEDNLPKINRRTQEIELFDSKRDYPKLEKLSRAAILSKSDSAFTLVMNGEGNTSSAQTFSNLQSNYRIQWMDLIRNNARAAARNLSIMDDGFVEVLKNEEMYDADTQTFKSTTDYNLREFVKSYVVYSFLDGLTDFQNKRQSSVYTFKNGTVGIYPSVNADKSYIGTLAVNLHKPSRIIALSRTLSTTKDAKTNLSYYNIIKSDDGVELLTDLIIAELGGFTTVEVGNDLQRRTKSIDGFYTTVWKNANVELTKALRLIGFPMNQSADITDLTKVNSWADRNGKTDLAKELFRAVRKYNNTLKGRNNPIILTDLIQFIPFKTTRTITTENGNQETEVTRLGVNPTLASLIHIHRSKSLFQSFIKKKELLLLKDLVNSGTSIYTESLSTEQFNTYKELGGESWINNGQIVFGRFTYTGVDGKIYTKDICNKKDLYILSSLLQLGNTEEDSEIEKLKKDATLLSKWGQKVELNPMIAKYNLLDYLVGQEWLISTIGAFYAHPSKAKLAPMESLSPDELEEFPANIEEDWASRTDASFKRNVSYTAAVHAFRINTMNGIPGEYTIAVIKDLVDNYKFNVVGKLSDYKATDGGMYVNPFVVILENNSLKGEKVGTIKKQFVHAYDALTGSQIIIKTAGFGITNETMRMSEFDQILMRKMTDRDWIDKNGNLLSLDILNGYKGAINYSNPNSLDGEIYFRFFDNNEDTWKYGKLLLDRCERNADGTYTRVFVEVDENGNELVEYDENGNEIPDAHVYTNEEFKITSNYDLWNFFGGRHSMELLNGNLEWSEHSIHAVVTAMNDICGNYDTTTGNFYLYISDGTYQYTVSNQREIYQPLKHSDIHYACGAGSVKVGAANINSSEAFTNEDDLNTMKIKLNLIGIQLDKEHRATGEDLSLMTLVISACIFRGYTLLDALDMYKGLHLLSMLETSKYRKAIDSNKLEELMVSIVLELASKTKLNNLALDELIKPLLEKYERGEQITLQDILEAHIPYSDSSVFSKLMSMTATDLTKKGIKVKIEGLLAILCPSYNRMMLYADRTLNEIENSTDMSVQDALAEELEDPKYTIILPLSTEIEENLIYAVRTEEGILYLETNSSDKVDAINLNIADGTILKYANVRELIGRNLAVIYKEDPNDLYSNEKVDYVTIRTELDLQDLISRNTLRIIDVSRLSDINIGRTYKLTNRDGLTHDVTVHTPAARLGLILAILSGEIIEVQENIIKGRNLSGYNCKFQDDEGNTYLLYDLLSTMDLFALNDAIKVLDDYKDGVRYMYDFDGFASDYESIEILSNAMEIVKRELGKSTGVIPDFTILTNTREDGTTSTGIDNADNLYHFKVALNKTVPILLRRLVQKDLDTIAKGGEVKIYNREELVKTTGNYESTLNEVILPKKFADEFGLKRNDSLQSIMLDRDFFINRLAENVLLNNEIKEYPENWDIAFKRLNGQHIHVLLKSHFDETNTNLQKKDTVRIITNDDDEAVYVDANGKEICPLANINEEIWEDEEGNEIIVSTEEDLTYYIDHLNYLTVELSENTLNIKSIEGLESLSLDIIHWLNMSSNETAKDYAERFMDDEEMLSTELIIKVNNSINKLENLKNSSFIIRRGREIHTSFLKSLDLIAARIPAQSQLSFMAMKVAGFVESDVNTAYVSTDQIWLQGSDFDIDSVSLAMFAINSAGLFVRWSPYLDLSSIERLKRSERFPLPTGQQVNMVESDQSPYLDTFSVMYRKKNNKITTRVYLTYLAILKAIDEINGIGPAQQHTPKWSSILKKYGINLNNVKDTDSAKKVISVLNEHYEKLWDKAIEMLKSTNDGTFEWNDKKCKEILKNLNIPTSTTIMNEVKELILKIINKHLMYLMNSSKSVRSSAIKNYNLLKIYNVSSNPRNAIEAHQSVDETTGEPKAIANSSYLALELKTHTFGNFMSKFLAVIENLIGKKCVGISANGLKIFAALSLYFNLTLNNPNIKSSEKRKLLIKTTLYAYDVASGKLSWTPAKNTEGRLLANVYVEDANILSSLDTELRDALGNVNLDEDAAILLSALLSLATDNAKELSLAKLNAGISMLGLYSYGIISGMTFKEVSDVMMSEPAVMINELLLGDAFGELSEMTSLSQVFNYILLGPSSALGSLDARIESGNNKSTVIDTISPWIISEFSKNPNLQGNSREALGKILERNKDLPFYNKLAIIANSITNKDLLLRYIEAIENIKISRMKATGSLYYKDSVTKAPATWKVARMMDFILDYFILVYTIKGTNYAKYRYGQFKDLAFGAAELRSLGNMLALNLGLPSSFADILSKLSLIEELTNLRVTESLLESRRNKFSSDFDLETYKSDNNSRFSLLEILSSPEEKQKVIDKYELNKYAFNILAVILNDELYVGYLETLKHAIEVSKVSARARASIEGSYLATQLLGAKSAKDISDLNKRVDMLIGQYINQMWLFTDYGRFKLPARLKFYTEETGGRLVLSNEKTDSPTYINLGTKAGAATFKLYMDTYVIPRIQSGRDKSNKPTTLYSGNAFIRDIKPLFFTNLSVSVEPVVAYSLPIEMLPNDPYQEMVFNRYKEDFNLLMKRDFSFGEHNLYELFYLYNIIVFNNRRTSTSLSSIFANAANTDIDNKRSKFINDFDKNNDIILPSKETNAVSITKDEFIEAIRLIRSPYSTTLNYIYAGDNDTLGYLPYNKAVNSRNDFDFEMAMSGIDMEDEGIYQRNTKKKNHERADLVIIQDREQTLEFTDMKVIHFKGKITKVYYKGKKVTGDFGFLPSARVKLDNGVLTITVDEKILRRYIEYKMNCK